MFFEWGLKVLIQFWKYKEILCCKKQEEINMWYNMINWSTDFVQISENFMLESIICFCTLFKIPHCIYIEQLHLHATDSDKFSFHFYSVTNTF